MTRFVRYHAYDVMHMNLKWPVDGHYDFEPIGTSLPETGKPHILFCINGLAIWHGFPDITHIKVNNGR